MDFAQILEGMGGVLLGASLGAGAGALVPPGDCSKSTSIVCGRSWNAAVGSGEGILAAGVIGLGVGIFSSKYRTAGLSAAATAAALVGLSHIATSET